MTPGIYNQKQTPRQRTIKKAVFVAAQKPRVGSGRSTGAPFAGSGRGTSALGLNQLQRRADSGAISDTQMAKTATERTQFAAKYGANWRDKVFGKGVRIGELNKQIANVRADPSKASSLAGLIERRKSALERRKRILAKVNQITPGRPS